MTKRQPMKSKAFRLNEKGKRMSWKGKEKKECMRMGKKSNKEG
jgi:hypothetical protein